LVSAHVEHLAHHWLLLAGPAFLPAVIVVGVVLYVAIKDRHTSDDDDAEQESDVGAPPACGGEERRR
jgi:hypothetical protein